MFMKGGSPWLPRPPAPLPPRPARPPRPSLPPPLLLPPLLPLSRLSPPPRRPRLFPARKKKKRERTRKREQFNQFTRTQTSVDMRTVASNGPISSGLLPLQLPPPPPPPPLPRPSPRPLGWPPSSPAPSPPPSPPSSPPLLRTPSPYPRRRRCAATHTKKHGRTAVVLSYCTWWQYFACAVF